MRFWATLLMLDVPVSKFALIYQLWVHQLVVMSCCVSLQGGAPGPPPGAGVALSAAAPHKDEWFV